MWLGSDQSDKNRCDICNFQTGFKGEKHISFFVPHLPTDSNAKLMAGPKVTISDQEMKAVSCSPDMLEPYDSSTATSALYLRAWKTDTFFMPLLFSGHFETNYNFYTYKYTYIHIRVCSWDKTFPYRFYIINKIKPIKYNCLKKGDRFSLRRVIQYFPLVCGKPIINIYALPPYTRVNIRALLYLPNIMAVSICIILTMI